ncbi:hypothetical protein [Streptomyces sp. SID3343]|uniref:hypothetical protein n=1 Tax=Streptomyces sp. SID3343 TaxID=2690260 RepID=UPI00136E096F|nr:hypothetical protein [Streptomyces sp. SID3343]
MNGIDDSAFAVIIGRGATEIVARLRSMRLRGQWLYSVAFLYLRVGGPMVERESIGRVLNPQHYDGEASRPSAIAEPREPLTTGLLSTLDNGGGGSGGGSGIRLTPAILHASASRLEGLTGEVRADTRTALQGADHVAVGRNLEVTKAVQYVHDRWGEKLSHLVEDMEERVARLRKAADHWKTTEEDIKKSFG